MSKGAHTHVQHCRPSEVTTGARIDEYGLAHLDFGADPADAVGGSSWMVTFSGKPDEIEDLLADARIVLRRARYEAEQAAGEEAPDA